MRTVQTPRVVKVFVKSNGSIVKKAVVLPYRNAHTVSAFGFFIAIFKKGFTQAISFAHGVPVYIVFFAARIKSLHQPVDDFVDEFTHYFHFAVFIIVVKRSVFYAIFIRFTQLEIAIGSQFGKFPVKNSI